MFAKIDPSPELLDEILRAIEAQKRAGGALEAREADGRSTIPHPTTWLNQKRWRDETAPAVVPFRQATEPTPQRALTSFELQHCRYTAMGPATDEKGQLILDQLCRNLACESCRSRRKEAA